MMKAFPFYKQPDSMDCGPACLCMIAAFHGKKYTVEKLREYMCVSREGVSLMGISKGAEKIGFKTLGGRLTLKQIEEKVPLPAIFFWDQNHFVVVYKVKRKRKDTFFYVADPGKGLLKYNRKTFTEHWINTRKNDEDKGVALLLEPTQQFYQQETTTTSHRKIEFLYNYFFQYKSFFLQLILGLLAGSLLQLIFPFLTQAIVDTGIGNQDISFIWLVLLAQLMLLLGRTSVDFIRRRILLHISTRINISLISDFFIKLMKLPMKFFDTKLLGDLLQRIEDHQRVERFLTAQSLNTLFSLFSFFIFGIVLFIYSINIFLVFIIGSSLYAIWMFIFLRRRKQLDYRIFEQQSHNRSKTYQLINGMQEIKLQGCEQQKRWEWEDTQANLFDVNLESLSLQQTQEAGSICINEIKNILITVLAAMAVIKGELTLGMMLSVQYIIGQLNSPVEQLMNFIYQWQDVTISLERMEEIHSKDEEVNKDKNISSLLTHKPQDIIIKELAFQYEGPYSPKVLNNINMTIPEGKITAIVGTSGSGKTTLVKLLLGNYEPQEGTITVGELPLSRFNPEWWRSRCGAVMQDGYIFSDSIARNIAPSDQEINIARLQKAAEIANIDEYIAGLPLGYNTVIGQEGQGVSQGQRQRILIARAVYKNPRFIFLDEATNALDANNEKAILKNLDTFYNGKTVVVVAHRLSTVKNADQIVVLDKGEIVEKGTHEELTRLKGKYYDLVKNQLDLEG